MSETARLQAEIRRLQAILDDNGIDYEPEQFGPPDRPMMGPPTRFEHSMHLQIQNMARRFSEWVPNIYSSQERQTADMKFMDGEQWASPLRIRLPDSFAVKS